MATLPLELIRKVRKIQIKTTKFAKDLLAGAYLSAFKGKGMEFEEVRSYQNGDEIRDIDWKVTARTGSPYVKTFKEEREMSVTLVVDVSASTHFGTGKTLKSDWIAEIGALIAFSAIKNRDKIGLILFSDEVEKYIPPKKGVSHVLNLILEILNFKPKRVKTDISTALNYIGNISRKSEIYFLISDFISDGYSKEIALIAKKCDLISIFIKDPIERTLPNLPLINFKDIEDKKESLVDLSDLNLRQEYEKKAVLKSLEVKSLMGKINAGFIEITTNIPYEKALFKFFSKRGKKRR